MSKREAISEITEQNIQFYFDGLRRRELDQKKLSLKSAQCLLIRDKLLNLPDEVYDTTIAAIHSLIELATKGPHTEVKNDTEQRKAAKQLYRQSQSAKS